MVDSSPFYPPLPCAPCHRPFPVRYGPERARLRRLALALADVLTPLVIDPAANLVGAYRQATAPAKITQLLDYIDTLHEALAEARAATSPDQGHGPTFAG